MIVLDTDHLSVLQHTGPNTTRIMARLEATGQEITTTIISFEEMARGWMAEINRAKTGSAQVPYYTKLGEILFYFSSWSVLRFDIEAAARFEELRSLRLRAIGTQDLKIAAICLSYKATLLSANLQHFRLIQGLHVEDWIHVPN